MAEIVSVKVEETGAEAPQTETQQPGEYIEFKEKPEWLPEKFYKAGEAGKPGRVSVKDLAKSYGELEKAKPAEKPAEKPTEKTEDEGKAETKAAPTVIPGVSPESVTKYEEEIKTGGKLSETSYAELAKAGFSKEVVDVYLKGIGADKAVADGVLAAAENERIIASVGGAEKLDAMQKWAVNNLKEAEIDAYNAAVSGGNIAAAELAIQGLQSRYIKANGQDLNLLDGDLPSQSGVAPYMSTYQLQLDMNSEAYRKDEGFRKQVEQRLAVSNIF